MKPETRRLKDLVQMKRAERPLALARGLELLAESVEVLEGDAADLGGAGKHQSAAVLRSFAEEEAAKALILVDMARRGFTDEAVNRAAAHFYSHLARRLYVFAYYAHPQDFAEVRGYMNEMTAKYWADGPDGFEYIFPNYALTTREGRLYVDYVRLEESFTWTSPAEYSRIDGRLGADPTSTASALVMSMREVGLLSEDGLTLTQEEWSSFSLQDSTRWAEIERLNQQVVRELAKQGICDPAQVVSALGTLTRSWSFPLDGLQLSNGRENFDELLTRRARAGEDLEGESL